MKTWVLLVAAAVVLSCTCRPQIPQAPPEDPGESEPAQERPIDPEPEAQPPEAPPAEAPAQPEPVPPGPADPEAPAEAPAAPEESFVVTEEVYNKTFDEVEEFIRNLNEIIRERDYQTWLTYLSDEYIRRTSDPGYLSEQSEKPLLKKNNLRLESLRDYFEYVVAPSRSQATIEDIEFISEDRVKVISSVRGTRGILYLLVRENGSWKIGVWE